MDTKTNYFENPLYKHHHFIKNNIKKPLFKNNNEINNIKYIDNPSFKNHNFIDSNVDNFTLDDFYEGMNNDIVEPPKNSICNYILYYITCGFYGYVTETYIKQTTDEVIDNQQKSEDNSRRI
jgi:hypothetical protein